MMKSYFRPPGMFAQPQVQPKPLPAQPMQPASQPRRMNTMAMLLRRPFHGNTLR